MPQDSTFLRSIRVRYLSGLLILALAAGGLIAMLNRANSYRHEVDTLGARLVSFSRDLNNASSFAETAAGGWRPDTRDELAAAGRGHAERLLGGIASGEGLGGLAGSARWRPFRALNRRPQPRSPPSSRA